MIFPRDSLEEGALTFDEILAQVSGNASELKNNFEKNSNIYFSRFGSAVLPTIANIQIYI